MYRNTLILLASSHLNACLSILTLALLARRLSVGAYGGLNASIATAFLAFQVVELGLSAIFTRRVARDVTRSGTEFARVFSLRLGLGATALCFLLGIALVLPPTPMTPSLIALLAVAFFFDFLADLSVAVLRGHQLAVGEALMNGLRSVLLLGGTTLWVVPQAVEPELTVGLVFVIASFARWAASMVALGRLGSIQPTFTDRRFWRAILSESVPLGAANLMSQLMTRVDVLLLAFLRGDREVGLYSPSYSLFSGLTIMWTTFLIVFFPYASRLISSGPGRFWRMWSRALIRITMVTVLIGLVVWIWAPEIVVVVFGDGYLETTRVLPLFLGANVFVALSSLCGMGLTASDAVGVITRAHAAALGLSVVLNLVLISRYGFVGAGVAFPVTHATAFVLLFESVSARRAQA